MFYFFLFLALSGGVLSYLNLDPMKSSFFLVFSLLSMTPIFSFSMHVWYSYFVCLLFLSGVFVILVYFSSLSSIGNKSGYLYFICFLLMLFSLAFFCVILGVNNLNVFYYFVFSLLFVFILFNLLFFMMFTSYYLSFSGALRKI